ncbi:MAG: hypothetical protein IKE51_06070 [Solobacterium sp.]|nr:hypothetical protein [Solobacterium sp.]
MRLIDAGALVEFLLKEIIECDKEYDEKSDHIILGAGQEAELIRDKVKEMPTVDIVRCKDCKYWKKCIDEDYCSYWEEYCWIPAMEDDFCSRGVKK